MPDIVRPVSELGGVAVQQVAIGSCTNSSYRDLMITAAILAGKTVHPQVSLVIAPGSRQVLVMLAENGALTTLLNAGARLLEAACGPCIGMGQSPATGAVSLRTFNRNFKGRSGTADAGIYLVSPETAAASALSGVLTDPRSLGEMPVIALPQVFHVDDSLVIPPTSAGAEIVRGPNIKALPLAQALPESLELTVAAVLGDNITTDDIMPAGAKILPLRSNIPAMSEFAFTPVCPDFPARARAAGQSVVVAGQNYGQGSSREHAALVPMHLGVRAVLALSFARIHRANLINNGILPLVFVDPGDRERLSVGGTLLLTGLSEALAGDEMRITVRETGYVFRVRHSFTPRQRELILAGGLLNCTRRITRS
jgi:aconitate hydratase